MIDDPEIEIVVEAVGGIDPAFEYVSQALARGKTVITPNKELIAKKGRELFQPVSYTHLDVYKRQTVEDMLAEHMESNEYSEITPVDDVNIDGITAKQYYRLHTGSNSVTLNVAFIYGDDLVTLTMWSLHDEICDDALNHFSEFVDSVKIDKK